MANIKGALHKAVTLFLNKHFFILVYVAISCVALLCLPYEWVFLATKACFIWGCFLVAYHCVFERELWKTKGIWLIIVFFFVNAISLILNLEMASPIIKGIAHNSILLLLIYPQTIDKQSIKNKGADKKFLVSVNNILIIFAFVLACISLIQFIFNIHYIVQRGSSTYHQGVWENRLFGLYSSPNVGALYGFLSVVLSAVNSLLHNKGQIKFSHFAWANICVQFCYFALSSSRGGLITICCFLVLLPFIFPPPLVQKARGIFKAGIYSVGVSVLFVASFMLISTTLRHVLPMAPNIIIKVENLQRIKENPIAPLEKYVSSATLTRSEQSDFSSARFDIWYAGLKGVKQVPFFGFGSADIYNNGKVQTAKFNEAELTEQDLYSLRHVNGNMHNVLMETILSTGILGVSVFLSFAAYLMIFYIKRLCQVDKSSYLYKYTGLTFCLIGALAVNSLVESHILFSGGDPVTFIFWLYLGSSIALLSANPNTKFETDLDDSKKNAGDETV